VGTQGYWGVGGAREVWRGGCGALQSGGLLHSARIDDALDLGLQGEDQGAVCEGCGLKRGLHSNSSAIPGCIPRRTW
jgi:hypothetical protein